MWKFRKKKLLEMKRLFSSVNGSRTKDLIYIPVNIQLQLGGNLKNLQITYEQWGDVTLPAERTIVIFPSFSHSSHAASNLDDPSPGWWQEMIGNGKSINSSYFRIICPSFLGSPFGSTCPLSINDKTKKPYRITFPQITPADMALCHAHFLDYLGVKGKVHVVIGGSLGGMQALEFAAQFPDRLYRLVALSCTAQTTPGTVAFRRVQRQAILSDPAYKNGDYTSNVPLNGMKVARELGMTCYRSREEFDERFDWKPQGPTHFNALTFDVERYMAYKSEKFASFYDPNCYLLLSKAMDLMNIGYGFSSLAKGLERIICETHVIGVKQDLLTPLNEQQCIVDILQSFDRKATLEIIDCKYGHDSMFNHQMQLSVFGPSIKKYIEKDYEEILTFEKLRYSSL